MRKNSRYFSPSVPPGYATSVPGNGIITSNIEYFPISSSVNVFIRGGDHGFLDLFSEEVVGSREIRSGRSLEIRQTIMHRAQILHPVRIPHPSSQCQIRSRKPDHQRSAFRDHACVFAPIQWHSIRMIDMRVRTSI